MEKRHTICRRESEGGMPVIWNQKTKKTEEVKQQEEKEYQQEDRQEAIRAEDFKRQQENDGNEQNF